jgi:hypothetical protein
LELKVASKFWEAYDVVDYLADFDNQIISHLYGKYFQLDDISGALKEKINHICGPPKLLTWFIVSCQKFKLESVLDLTNEWDKIEEGAIGMYRKQWFTMKNVQDLVSAIKFSSSDHTAKGKVFEYLFALELCSLTDSPLWKELGKFGLKPLTNWVPAVEKMGRIDSAIDKSKVYVIVDPDRSNSKTDVLFFANSISLNTQVRVLSQLTIQKKNSTEKAQTSF